MVNYTNQDYSKLVENLRMCGTDSCIDCMKKASACYRRRYTKDAADTIENLLTENAALRRQIDNLTSAQAMMAKEFDKKLAEIEVMRNELCYKCGNYEQAHNGWCDHCRWKEA